MGGCCGKEEKKDTNVEKKEVAEKSDEKPAEQVEVQVQPSQPSQPEQPAQQADEEQKQVEVKVEKQQFECKRCKINFDSQEELDAHMKSTHCPLCGKTFKDAAAIEAHLPKCGHRIVVCPECKAQVKKKDLKGDHLKDCNSVTCEYCEKSILKSNYDDHKSNKCLKRPVCTPCCAQEMKYCDMIKHIATCPDVLEDCDYCGKDIKRGELEAHLLECEEKKKDDEAEAENIDNLTKDEALERLKSMKTGVGFVAMDCPEIGIRVVRLRIGSGSLYSFVCNGDLIREMDNTQILTIDDLKEFLKTKLPGDVVDTKVKRGVDGRTEIIPLELYAQGELTGQSLDDIRKLRTISELPTSQSQIFTTDEALDFLVATKNRIGFVIQDGPEDGIRIAKVSRKGPAWRAGIRPMDLVTKVNDEKVTTKKEFAQVWKTFKCGDPVPFEVERAGYLLQDPCIVEVGAKSKEKNIVEKVRALRLLAGMEIFDPDGLSDSDSDDNSSDSSNDTVSDD